MTTYANLKDLFTALRSGAEEVTAELPVFGGDEPANTMSGPIWSWDETHFIVGAGRNELRLISREDYANERAAR